MQIIPIKAYQATQINTDNQNNKSLCFGSISPKTFEKLQKKEDVFFREIVLPIFQKTEKFQLYEFYKSRITPYLIKFSDKTGREYQVEHYPSCKIKKGSAVIPKALQSFIKEMKSEIINTNKFYAQKEKDEVRKNSYSSKCKKGKTIADIDAQYKQTRKWVCEEISNLSDFFNKVFTQTPQN